MSNKIVQPTYLTKLPSTGKQVKFRPFTVKEEKSLLLALQDADANTITEAIKNVISVCTSNIVDPENIPYYDAEFLFLQIRSKSIGEIIQLVGSCSCDKNAKTDFEIDVTEAIIMPVPTGLGKIKIPDTNYTVQIRHPSLSDFTSRFSDTEDSSFKVVANCIQSIFTDEEVMNWSPDEKLDFVSSMTSIQQIGIAKFLKEMPMCQIPTKYKCIKCSKLHDEPLVGFQNFFL